MNYIFITFVRSILIVKRLFKSLWKEIIKTTIYIKNKNLEIDKITLYERLKDEKSNFKHMRTIETRTWIHVLKEKRKKLIDKSWQRIFVEYEENNQFRVHNSKIDEVHVVKGIQMNEISTYNMRNNQNNNVTDVQWADKNDNLFRNFYDLDDSDEDFASSTVKFASKNRIEVQNRVSIN